ncbi:hypothetical protein ACFXPT_36400 [Streptomyces goshikiensis]|uniref:hypothetical protein n=1 Tax=Streptomyces goshikiensis TaxID=1942 RepID=UPI0036C0A474
MEKKYRIAIRETGRSAINRIADGAKPKPHTILEKSIKMGSIEKAYPGDVVDEVLSRLKGLDLDGFVGHWGAAGQGLLGVRIDNAPDEVSKAGIIEKGDAGDYVPIEISAADGGPRLARLKEFPRWKQYLYTGDYDLHEVYAGTRQIPEATLEKVKLLNRLNAGIADNYEEGGVEKVERRGVIEKVGRTLRMQDGSEYAMFQHGDQATYRMNQILELQEKVEAAESKGIELSAEERRVRLVPAVSEESSEPLAWCFSGKWYVTLNRAEHAEMRRRLGIVGPNTWEEQQRPRKMAS